MEKVVITIARQYGSGGKTIGEMLAKKLQIHFYDKELLRLASDESGINEALFANADEMEVSFIKMNPFSQWLRGGKGPDGPASPDSEEFTSMDNLFQYQAKIIQELAARESCIIMGRCADYVLRDYPNVLSIFVHAPKDFCMEMAAKKHSMGEKELEKYIQTMDKRRAGYYKYHTGREWTDARNYDLCLNSSKLGFERCVEEIIAYMQVRFGGKEGQED